jgi:hypothetical protein
MLERSCQTHKFVGKGCLWDKLKMSVALNDRHIVGLFDNVYSTKNSNQRLYDVACPVCFKVKVAL